LPPAARLDLAQLRHADGARGYGRRRLPDAADARLVDELLLRPREAASAPGLPSLDHLAPRAVAPGHGVDEHGMSGKVRRPLFGAAGLLHADRARLQLALPPEPAGGGVLGPLAFRKAVPEEAQRPGPPTDRAGAPACAAVG
jgi:hypothetical protein